MVSGATPMRIRKVVPVPDEQEVAVPTPEVASEPLDGTKLGPVASKILDFMKSQVVGQEEAIEKICTYHQIYEAGLDSPGKPVASLFLMGPTGVGKTRSVEVLAEAIHGTPKAFLKIDCGEYQMDHEVAKLIGAPPGYLGHRETKPLLTQQALTSVSSDKSRLSLVLFDEIEKSAPSMWRLLMGILDKGQLSLGDNTTVDFTNSMIFFTSNLGVKEINALISPSLGFTPGTEFSDVGSGKLAIKIQAVTDKAIERAFPLEFINRLDDKIVFNPLDHEDLLKVEDLEFERIQKRINASAPIRVVLSPEAREWLSTVGFDAKFGARQLKRQLERYLVRPLANIIQSQQVVRGDTVVVSCNQSGLQFIKESVDGKSPEAINA